MTGYLPFTKELAEDMGCPVETLINNEVEAVHHRAELAKWREEDAAEEDDFRWNGDD